MQEKRFLVGGASYRLERNRSATFSTHNRNRALTLINAISGVKTAYKVYMAYRSPIAFSFAEGQLRYDSVMLCWKVAPNTIRCMYGVKKVLRYGESNPGLHGESVM